MGVRRAGVVGAVLLVMLAVSMPAAWPSTSVARSKVTGYAFAIFGNCPQTPEPPPPGTVCHEAFIQVFRESFAIDGGGLAPPKTPWQAFYYESTATFQAGGDPAETDVRWGFLDLIDPSAVTYDRQHLEFASVDVEIPLSNGTAVAVNMDWHAGSERFVYGNDGPALSDFGLIHHYVDRCSTQVNQGHQKFRVAAMTGTVNGAAVHSYTNSEAGFISLNHFVFIDATHGPVCG
jgi:hypothetical protein